LGAGSLPLSWGFVLWLAQYAPAGDNVDMFHGDRRTDTFGFIDNITLRVCYDAPTPGKSTVVAVSHCGNPDHAFDYGQNKRNLNQVGWCSASFHRAVTQNG
jgi:hypothetical protein